MRRVVVSMFVTLDGVMESPDKWSFPFWTDEIAEFKHNELFAGDALLLGRVTYQGFAAAWPTMTDTGDFGVRMNTLPKIVASTTLTELEWNAIPIKSNIAAHVTKLKKQPGHDILVFGSADLVHTLMQHDLIDEYRLLVYPVVRGNGKRLFREGEHAALKLVETRTYSTGVVLLRYEPDRKP